MRVSSRDEQETLYEMRQQLRLNVFDHSSFKPKLESMKNKLLFKEVYQLGSQDPSSPKSGIISPELLAKPVQEFLTRTGSYKNINYRICDQFQKKQKTPNRNRPELVNDNTQVTSVMSLNEDEKVKKLFK